MSDKQIVVLHPVKTLDELKEHFIDEEIGFEIVSFKIGRQPDGTLVNFVEEVENLEVLPPLSIEVPTGGKVDEAFLKSVIAKKLRILPGTFSGIVNGKQVDFVVCRPRQGGPVDLIVRRGKMSFFGGPADQGVGVNEGLALVEVSEMPLYPANMFLTPSEAGAPGLARRLNPKKPYIACRWEELGLPIGKFRKHLQLADIEVESVATGQKISGVRAVDAGPGILTRVCDLSPIFQSLGLDTDNEVIVRIPQPAQTAKELSAANRDVRVLSDLADEVAIPAAGTFNVGLTAVSESAMIKKFGVPGALTKDCSDPNSAFEKRVVRKVDVGPFKVNGLKEAVDLLKAAFDEVKQQFPEVFAQVRNDDLGMLCVRHRRTDENVFSNHSWGTALDLKFADEEIGQGTPLTQRGFLSLFPIFNKFGWFWGAGFSGKSVDSMHFELSQEAIDKIAAT